MPGYDPAQIEKKWQATWLAHKVFAAPDTSGKPTYYVLDMFPYPSGQGLHVGHPEGYTATDIVSRYKRARGYAVMHPMGWDAFGLPAEQYAIKSGTHPRATTEANIHRFREQLQALGFSYDWDREVDTTNPGYFKWTQWIFLQLFDTWFDEKQQKGRPIVELVEEFQTSKSELLGRVASFVLKGDHRDKKWEDFTPSEQRRILAHYRLAYIAEVPVNWCPGLGTVLANEEVIDGKSEVGGFPVERRPMRQWMLRITAYAERLLAGLDKLEWSDSLKEMQRNWIGKSEGAEVRFRVEGSGVGGQGTDIVVFTTRPDTLFGATYMVMAPEHPLVDGLTTPAEQARVTEYRKWAASRSDRERQEDTRKTGQFTGSLAINPVNGEKIPIYISDYVLMGYGTGAIMAVPGHDERDHEFATKFALPIKQVVAPGDRSAFDVQRSAFTDEGIAVNSPWIDGLPTPQARSKIIDMLESKGLGRRQVNYKIRDWLFSRQRYWGEPFPLVHLADGTVVRLADEHLPVLLPVVEDYKPTGTIDPPLSKATDWVNVHVVIEKQEARSKEQAEVARIVAANTPGAVPARRELNVMPQWAGSSWYYLRYTSPHDDQRFVNAAAEKYWLSNGVDLYVGGVEHAVLHLLYARFWHKVLFDHGLVSCDEPFRRLVNQGLILGETEYTAFQTEAGGYVSLEHIDPSWEARTVGDKRQTISTDTRTGTLVIGVALDAAQAAKQGDAFVLRSDPSIKVDARSFKMSKSRGNVINPDDVIRDYGADALRMFEMFMGPLEQVKPWSTAGVEGVYRFLQRVWRNLFDADREDAPKTAAGTSDEALERALHRTIKKVTDDIERMSFNTAIAAMMEFNNTLTKAAAVPTSVAERFLRVLEPFAPHFADEAYHRIAAQTPDPRPQTPVSISQLPWPEIDPKMLVDDTIEVPVQVNGKLRGRVRVPNGADEATVIAAALADADVQRFIAGQPLKKKIYVKGRLVNLVV